MSDVDEIHTEKFVAQHPVGEMLFLSWRNFSVIVGLPQKVLDVNKYKESGLKNN
jgi:hypothetical protein